MIHNEPKVSETKDRTVAKSIAVVIMVLVRIFILLIALKFLAHQFGASGFGFLTQVMAVGATFSSLAGGGLVNGLVREIAASKTEAERISWLQSAIFISTISAVVLAAVSYFLYMRGSQLILGDEKFSWVFLLIGATQIVTGYGLAGQSYLSGLGYIGTVSIAGILGGVLSVLIIALGGVFFGLSGAIVGCAIIGLSPSLVALVFFFRKFQRQNIAETFMKIDKKRIAALLKYGLAFIVTASAVPLVLIEIRSTVGLKLGWHEVGYWQAISRIGDAYIQVIGMWFLSVLLPRLSGISSRESLQTTISWMTPVMIIFFIGGFVLWSFSPYILKLVYSDNFTPSRIYVVPQLVADGFKIVSGFLLYRFIALGMPFVQVGSDAAQAIVTYISFVYFFPEMGALAAVYSYADGCIAAFLFALSSTLIEQRILLKE